jgi:hypothetical protein
VEIHLGALKRNKLRTDEEDTAKVHSAKSPSYILSLALQVNRQSSIALKADVVLLW